MVQERSKLTSPRKKERNSKLKANRESKRSIISIFSPKQKPKIKAPGNEVQGNESRGPKPATPPRIAELKTKPKSHATIHAQKLNAYLPLKEGTYQNKNKNGTTRTSKLPPRPTPPRRTIKPKPKPRSICYQLKLNKMKIMEEFRNSTDPGRKKELYKQFITYDKKYTKRGCNILKPRKQANIPNERLSQSNGSIVINPNRN
jgi:hypothetical protein